MKKVSNEFINLSKKIKTQDLKLTINDGELTVQEVHFMPVNIFNSIPVSRLRARKEVIAKELKYSFEGQLFKTIMQQIEITVKNASEIKGKKIDFKYGILINNEFEYLDMGEYFIKDVEDDKNKEELVVTGYDKMLNFMIPFKQSDLKLTYPCKMGQLVSRMGEICGVELYSTDFYNADLIVDEDFFTVQELTYRDVLEKVAQTTLTTIFIKENKLYLCKIGDSVQTFDTSFLSDLVIGERFGPINALVLGRGSVEDNVEAVDQQSINSNGRCEIRFDENEFVDSKREQVIDGMLKQINGLEYYAVEASNLGVLWLEPCDVITVKDREESEYKTIYLKANVTINTGIKGEMESSIPETTTTEYKVTSKEEKKTLKVERLAKKNEGLIQDLIQETSDHTEKLTKHEQDIDSIKDSVHKLEEFTRTITETNQVHLNETAKGQGYILELKIKGNSENFKYLTPSNELTPTNTLVPNGGHFTLVCDKQSKTSISSEAVKIDVVLENPLRNLDDVYDELNIIDGKTTVTRRVGVNNDGSLYVLDKAVIETLQNVKLTTFDSNTYIYIKEFTGLEYIAKYIIKSEYSDKFITKVEADTKIEQKAESINIGVNKKLESYSTTEEMNSAIQLKANEITSTVSSTYATKGELSTEKSERIQTTKSISEEVRKKVGEEEFGTKIEQNWEHVKLAWNQISEFIQMMIINGSANLAILDKNKNILMSLDKQGQHFYKDGKTIFGEMGIQKIDNQNYISFAVEGEYEKSSSDGMSWGIKTKSDNKFYPILYIKNFEMGPKNSDGGYGELVLNACNLVLNGIGTGILSGGIMMYGDPSGSALYFEDVNTKTNILTIRPANVLDDASLTILGNIMFYANKAGSNSFKIGNCLFTDDGSVHCKNMYIGNTHFSDGEITGNVSFNSIPRYHSNPFVYGTAGHEYSMNWTGSKLSFYIDASYVGDLSDRRLKTEIKEVDKDLIKAIGELDYKQFKKDNRNGLISVGIIAQDLIKILKKYNKNPEDYEILEKFQYKFGDNTLYYSIDYEQFILLRMMAKEQEIENLKKQNTKRDKMIEDLIKRIETLEKEANNGQDNI